MKLFIKYLILLTFFHLSGCHEKNYDIMDLLINKKTEAEKKTVIKNIEKKDIKENQIIKENRRASKDNSKKELFRKKETITDSDYIIDKAVEKKIDSEKTDNKEVEKNIKNSRNLNSRVLENIDKVEEEHFFKEYENENFSLNKKIGVMLPLTGENAAIGKLILNALELALFQSKDSNLELVIKDTKSNPKQARIVFIELIQENITNVIGPLFSKSLVAVEDLVKANTSVFALTNNKNLAKKGIWIFGIDPQEQTERILSFSINEGTQKLAALLPQNAYGLLLFQSITDFMEINSFSLERVEFYENSIVSQEQAAKKISQGFDKYEKYLKDIEENSVDESLINIEKIEKPFDNVFIAASGQSLTVLASQLQYNNVDPNKVQFLGIASWEDKSILSEPALDGGLFSTTSQLYQKDISRIYRNSFGKNMPKISMIAYDILALLNSAENNKESLNINTLINEEGFLGLRGLFRLNNNGTVERAHDIKIIKNKKFNINEKAKEVF